MNPDTVNVYLVSHGPPEELCIDGLFSSLEQALARLKEKYPNAEWDDPADASRSSGDKHLERWEIVGRFPQGARQRFEIMVHEVDA